MRNNRKELQLVADIAETVLQYRMDSSPAYEEHLRSLRKEVKKMRNTEVTQPGIAHLLVKSEQYKVKGRITKMAKNTTPPFSPLRVCIRIQCIQKSNCEVQNQEFWEIKTLLKEPVQDISEGNAATAGSAIAELIEFLLTNLFCYTLMPFKKELRNKYLLDYKLYVDGEPTPDLLEYDSIQAL